MSIASSALPPSRLSGLMPWNDRSGQLSLLRLVVFAALSAPAIWLAIQTVAGLLGPRPITEAIHQSGTWTIRWLLAAMSVTPLRLLTGWNRLAGLRRMVGLSALAYAVLHFSLYILDQQFDMAKVASEIVLRVYLTIGFTALIGLIVLGLTSFDAAIRRLGAARWKRLHLIVHPIAILGLVHFFMQTKLDVYEATLVMGLFLIGECLRLVARFDKGPSVLGVAIAGLAGVVLTAGLEMLWYALATRVPAFAILKANLILDPAMLRPAWYVAAVALACIAVAGVIRPFVRRGREPRRRPG